LLFYKQDPSSSSSSTESESTSEGESTSKGESTATIYTSPTQSDTEKSGSDSMYAVSDASIKDIPEEEVNDLYEPIDTHPPLATIKGGTTNSPGRGDSNAVKALSTSLKHSEGETVRNHQQQHIITSSSLKLNIQPLSNATNDNVLQLTPKIRSAPHSSVATSYYHQTDVQKPLLTDVNIKQSFDTPYQPPNVFPQLPIAAPQLPKAVPQPPLVLPHPPKESPQLPKVALPSAIVPFQPLKALPQPPKTLSQPPPPPLQPRKVLPLNTLVGYSSTDSSSSMEDLHTTTSSSSSTEKHQPVIIQQQSLYRSTEPSSSMVTGTMLEDVKTGADVVDGDTRDSRKVRFQTSDDGNDQEVMMDKKRKLTGI